MALQITIKFKRKKKADLEGRVEQLEEGINQIMATQAEFEARLIEADLETDRLALEIQALRDQIAAGGMTAAAEADVLARLDATIAKLKGVGKPPEA
jgi:septal ring factor EnvC (AmiA/AmiB activator)